MKLVVVSQLDDILLNHQAGLTLEHVDSRAATAKGINRKPIEYSKDLVDVFRLLDKLKIAVFTFTEEKKMASTP